MRVSAASRIARVVSSSSAVVRRASPSATLAGLPRLVAAASTTSTSPSSSSSKSSRRAARPPAVVVAAPAPTRAAVSTPSAAAAAAPAVTMALDSANWPADKVRDTFVRFFEEKAAHVHYRSSPVVPHDDPTLLFANAGMNQVRARAVQPVQSARLRLIENARRTYAAAGRRTRA